MKSRQDFATEKEWLDYLRYHYSGMAMQGIVSNHCMIDTDHWEWLADNSVKAADALIAALNKTE